MGFLVLTRRIGEKIMIGDDVTITVIDNRGGVVRLAIRAPKKLDVWRQEIYDRIACEKAHAKLKAQAEARPPAPPTLPEYGEVPHEYGPSARGHGDPQCVWCQGTVQANAMTSPDHCQSRAELDSRFDRKGKTSKRLQSDDSGV